MQKFLIGQLNVDRSKCFVISSDHKSLTATNCIMTKFKLGKVKKTCVTYCHIEPKHLKEPLQLYTPHTSSNFNYLTHTYHQYTLTRLLNTHKICMAMEHSLSDIKAYTLHRTRTNKSCNMKFNNNICNVKFCTKIKQAFRNYSSTKIGHVTRTSILSKHKAWVNPLISNSLLCATVFLTFFAYKATNW